MKELLLSKLLWLLVIISIEGQVPQALNYQGIARELSSGGIISNQNIRIRIAILRGSTIGEEEYKEIHATTTNELGLFNIKIGAGIEEIGDFSEIDWGNAEYYIQIELDEDGASEFQIIGVTQLLSVPYSLFAASGGEWRKFEDGIFYESGSVRIGADNSEVFNSTPTLNIFGDSNPDNFALRLEQGGEGTKKGIFIGTPNSQTSGRIFLDNDNFSMGRANSDENLTMLNLKLNGNIGIGEINPMAKLHVNGDMQIGASNGLNFNSTPALNIFGDTDPNNFIMRLEQGGEGTKKGIFIGSPISQTSGRIFLDSNIFSIGRANTEENLTMLNLGINGNIGINETEPKSKLHLKEGDIYLEEIGKGIIMRSPNGECWRMTLNNNGELVSTTIDCPN